MRGGHIAGALKEMRRTGRDGRPRRRFGGEDLGRIPCLSLCWLVIWLGAHVVTREIGEVFLFPRPPANDPWNRGWFSDSCDCLITRIK